MNRSGKIEVLKEIRNSKDVLFGCFSKSLTKQEKILKWKEIHNKALALGVVPTDKDYKYTRDTFWQNMRKNALKKSDNAKKTGSEGGTDCKYTETDNIVFDIIGKDTPVMVGLPVKETWEEDHINDEDDNEDNDRTSPINNTAVIQDLSSTVNSRPIVHVGSKKKANSIEEEELKLKKLKLTVEIMEKESYLKTLEIAKLERDLGLAPSKFTEQLTGVDYVFVEEHISGDGRNTV